MSTYITSYPAGSCALPDGRGECFVVTPFKFVDALLEQSFAKPEGAFPLGKCLGLSVKGDGVVAAPVVSLLGISGPIAIAWRVVFSVIVSFYGMVRGGLISHVINKTTELHPPDANTDASSSINSVFVVSRINAAILHCSPTAILRGAAHVMRSVYAFHYVRFVTTARRSMAKDEMLRSDSGESPTFTSARPHGFLSPRFGNMIGCSGEHGESGKGVTGKVFEFCHNFLHEKLLHKKECGSRLWMSDFQPLSLATEVL